MCVDPTEGFLDNTTLPLCSEGWGRHIIYIYIYCRVQNLYRRSMTPTLARRRREREEETGVAVGRAEYAGPYDFTAARWGVVRNEWASEWVSKWVRGQGMLWCMLLRGGALSDEPGGGRVSEGERELEELDTSATPGGERGRRLASGRQPLCSTATSGSLLFPSSAYTLRGMGLNRSVGATLCLSTRNRPTIFTILTDKLLGEDGLRKTMSLPPFYTLHCGLV